MNIHDKVVIVTGGAGGIGRAMAQRFRTAGARAVVIADLHADAVAATAKDIDCHGAVVDVSKEDQVIGLIDDTEARHGPVDLFCANAGIGNAGGLDADNSAWQRNWDINVMAHVCAARHLVPRMLERGGGYFLHTASAAGLLSQFEASYAVTKHAAVAFAEWLSITYGDRGIGVSCLCPMGVDTAMFNSLPPDQRERTAAGHLLSPEQVAEVVLQGIENEQFLILPHEEVLDFWRAKTNDNERWLRGMRRFHALLEDGG